jgi:8-oxo-dGTP pyrophosphatase MutT (NUDIX family)
VTPDDVRRALEIHVEPAYDPRAALVPGARDAAVLVPLTFDEGTPLVHLVVRSDALRDHAGEVGFPGGKIEPGETATDALLREAEEEVGIRRADLELLGSLSPTPVVTGRFLLLPTVAALHAEPRITSTEHASIHAVPLAPWLDGASVVDVTRSPWRGIDVVIPHFPVGDRVMYGASAIILFELLARLSGGRLRTRLVHDKPWGDRYRADEEDALLR